MDKRHDERGSKTRTWISLILNNLKNSDYYILEVESLFDFSEMKVINIDEYLEDGLILIEKKFRKIIKLKNWKEYKNVNVAINSKNKAIIPTWAYMIISSYLSPFAKNIIEGDLFDLKKYIFSIGINKINIENIKDKNIIVKGCSKINVPISSYVELCKKIQPYANTINFGEICSKVPVYRKKIIL
ncbi:MAG: DUF2480 family protein [Flavobacteriales bacterium TMED288]|nr:hypothetical protein [Flavobacteriales bacterium]MAJ98125.1 hypothetical protein [Flavobacteriales bacterium]RPG52944.1 MAG: DUF2480 family protein [Flavobacteriales bacterium TMED288]